MADRQEEEQAVGTATVGDIARTDWREEKTVQQCLSYICLKENLSDVAFTFASHQNVSLPAHKFVLSMRSTVFEAMFYGPLAERNEVIRIEDIGPDTMAVILRYIYSDEAKINGDNVLRCLYGARKYALDRFANACSSYLVKNLSADNVFLVLEQARLYNMKNLQKTCLDFILENAVEVFDTDEFLSVSQETLCTILQSDSLSDNEVHVFQTCLKWATHRCKQEKLEASAANMRSMLGPLLYQIRFPTMKLEQFAKSVSSSGLLTYEEEALLYRGLVTNTPIPENRFISRLRSGELIKITFIQKNTFFKEVTGYNLQVSRVSTAYPAHFGMNLYQGKQADSNEIVKLAVIEGSFVPEVAEIWDNANTKHEFNKNGEYIQFRTPMPLPVNLSLRTMSSGYGSSYILTRNDEIGGLKIQVSAVPKGIESLSFHVKRQNTNKK